MQDQSLRDSLRDFDDAGRDAAKGRLYPVQGPLAAQSPVSVCIVKFVRSVWHRLGKRCDHYRRWRGLHRTLGAGRLPNQTRCHDVQTRRRRCGTRSTGTVILRGSRPGQPARAGCRSPETKGPSSTWKCPNVRNEAGAFSGSCQRQPRQHATSWFPRIQSTSRWSPSRRVARSRSRYSSSGIAYLRETPARSLNCGTLRRCPL